MRQASTGLGAALISATRESRAYEGENGIRLASDAAARTNEVSGGAVEPCRQNRVVLTTTLYYHRRRHEFT